MSRFLAPRTLRVGLLTIALALLAAGAGARTLIGIGTAGAAQPPTVQNVHEQNVDAQGNIKVHEQGTPSVKIDPTANTVKLDPTAAPVPTIAADNPAFTPVNSTAIFLLRDANLQGVVGTVYTVPAGHELVIEQFSIRGTEPLGSHFVATYFRTVAGGQVADFDVATTVVAADSADVEAGDMETHVYADPQTTVDCVVGRNASETANAGVECNLSGYLVPLKPN